MSLLIKARNTLTPILLMALEACSAESNPPAAVGLVSSALSVPNVACSALLLNGDPASAGGANWTYVHTDDGVAYNLEGHVRTPTGAGPFPAMVLSHGNGGFAQQFGVTFGPTVRDEWGMVLMAPRLQHANNADGHESYLLPDSTPSCGASAGNVQRIHKTWELLSCLNVDLSRVAGHGHSMGAFATCETAGSYAGDFRAVSQSGGGAQVMQPTYPFYECYCKVATVNAVRSPYQMHYGSADTTTAPWVNVAQAQLLAKNQQFGSPGSIEMHVYIGAGHVAILPGEFFPRIERFYRETGVLTQ